MRSTDFDRWRAPRHQRHAGEKTIAAANIGVARSREQGLTVEEGYAGRSFVTPIVTTCPGCSVRRLAGYLYRLRRPIGIQRLLRRKQHVHMLTAMQWRKIFSAVRMQLIAVMLRSKVRIHRM